MQTSALPNSGHFFFTDECECRERTTECVIRIPEVDRCITSWPITAGKTDLFPGGLVSTSSRIYRLVLVPSGSMALAAARHRGRTGETGSLEWQRIAAELRPQLIEVLQERLHKGG